MVTEKLVCFTA